MSNLIVDFYEFVMANILSKKNKVFETCYFDMFFRNTPDDGGFAIFCGLDTLIDNLLNFKFLADDIAYLKSLNTFDKDFLEYLKNFKFNGTIYSAPEGTVVFANEPYLIIKGTAAEAALVETLALQTINHQSLIATKTNRMVRAALGRDIVEFGARRAHGKDAAVFGARAAYIGGAIGTSCTQAAKNFKIPPFGTTSHSFVGMYDTELEAFASFAKIYPQNCILLIDTYNTLKSGIKNAIKVFNTEILPRGFRPVGVRIDSGDITYLSKKVRKELDSAGFKDCKICASNALDEYLIRDMIYQGAKVDIFGVGEKLITAASSPVFSGVLKLSAICKDNKIIPKIKISDNPSKITTPGAKNVVRFFDNQTKKALADLVTLKEETIDPLAKSYEIFDPKDTWKKKTLTNFYAEPIFKKIFDKGELVYKKPTIDQIKLYCKEQMESLWDEVKRFENPHKYYVDLSYKLYSLKKAMIEKYV